MQWDEAFATAVPSAQNALPLDILVTSAAQCILLTEPSLTSPVEQYHSSLPALFFCLALITTRKSFIYFCVC